MSENPVKHEIAICVNRWAEGKQADDLINLCELLANSDEALEEFVNFTEKSKN
ncbi:MAG: hypothetical protein Q7R73_03945 [bacterium]|nr:hypothetical protein [bacterium]